MDALLMCGGRGTRLDADTEKPLYPIGGEPMVDRVRRALAGSELETTYGVVSPRAPQTRDHLAEAGVPLIETPGDGYVSDLARALDDPRVDPPVVTVAADLPLLEADLVDDVREAYDGYRRRSSEAPSMTVCVPVAAKARLGLPVGERSRPGDDRNRRGRPRADERPTSDDSLAPTGLNVVGATDAEVIHVCEDPRLAINVNRLEDARIAEAMRVATDGGAPTRRRRDEDPARGPDEDRTRASRVEDPPRGPDGDGAPRVVLAAGTTRTALIDGISAAGATPELMAHTPPADAEILVYGAPALAPVTPVSPTGCVTPAAATRAVREVRDFPVTVVDAGLAESTVAPTVDLGADPGADVRRRTAVPRAGAIVERAAELGAAFPDDELLIGETIPGGTTTALAVLTALGESVGVSSSLPENPLERKRSVVADALSTSGLEPGDCLGAPIEAIACVGDPVQAVVAGIAAGAIESGTDVTLAGGTQQVAVAALLRHAGIEVPLTVATTSFVADDRGTDLAAAASRLDLELTVTDPGFDEGSHLAMERYCAGEAKEGVAMGGALSLVPDGAMAAVRERFVAVCERLGVGGETGDARGAQGGGREPDADGPTEVR